MTVTVLGIGSWGTALALVLGRNGHDVTLVGRQSEPLAHLCTARENLKYLPGFVLPENVRICEFSEISQSSELLIVAVPSQAIEELLPVIDRFELVAIASKGFAPGSEALLSELARGQGEAGRIVALSGPNLALELAKGIPTVAVAASASIDSAEMVRKALHCRTYRIYISDDVVGVETAGALKNVMAIAAGMSDGLGFGDNTKGALLARGLYEMTRLGMAMGAHMETFLGIAGVGDLFATANSKLSRNYRVGYGLGEGKNLEKILHDIGQVAEGVTTAELALQLAQKFKIDVPIIGVVHRVMHGQIDARSAVWQLMERTPKNEMISEVMTQKDLVKSE